MAILGRRRTAIECFPLDDPIFVFVPSASCHRNLLPAPYVPCYMYSTVTHRLGKSRRSAMATSRGHKLQEQLTRVASSAPPVATPKRPAPKPIARAGQMPAGVQAMSASKERLERLQKIQIIDEQPAARQSRGAATSKATQLPTAQQVQGVYGNVVGSAVMCVLMFSAPLPCGSWHRCRASCRSSHCSTNAKAQARACMADREGVQLSTRC